MEIFPGGSSGSADQAGQAPKTSSENAAPALSQRLANIEAGVFGRVIGSFLRDGDVMGVVLPHRCR